MRGLGRIAAIAVVAAGWGGGAASAEAADSASCSARVADGYAGGVYVRLGAQLVDADTTRVCFRVDGGSAAAGGAFTVDAPGVRLGMPRVDQNDTACTATTPNSAPGPHPLVDGAVSGVRVFADTWSGAGEAWLCLAVGTTRLRVVVPAQGVTPPAVTFEPDTGASPLPAGPPAGYPSGSCVGANTRLLNASFAGAQLFAAPSASGNGVDLCVRTAAGGGRLTVQAPTADVHPIVQQGDDLAGCTVAAVDFTSPVRIFVGHSSTAAKPASVCVQVGAIAKRLTVGATGTGITSPGATWTPDPDTDPVGQDPTWEEVLWDRIGPTISCNEGDLLCDALNCTAPTGPVLDPPLPRCVPGLGRSGTETTAGGR